MEGFLLRKVTAVLLFKWKKEYFLIHDGRLHYFETKNSARLGYIDLRSAVLKTSPKDPLVIILDVGSEMHYLKATSIKDKVDWMQSLNKTINEQPDEQSFDDGGLENPRDALDRAFATRVFSKLDDIEDRIARVWSMQAQIEESLSLLAPALRRAGQGPVADQARALQGLTQDFKEESYGVSQDLDRLFKNIGGILVNFAQSNADLAPLIGVENSVSHKSELAVPLEAFPEKELHRNGKREAGPFEGGEEESRNSTPSGPLQRAPEEEKKGAEEEEEKVVYLEKRPLHERVDLYAPPPPEDIRLWLPCTKDPH